MIESSIVLVPAGESSASTVLLVYEHALAWQTCSRMRLRYFSVRTCSALALLCCSYLVRRTVDLIGTMVTTTWQYSKPWLDIGRDQPTRSMKRSSSRSSRGGRSSRSCGAEPARPPFRRIQRINHYHIGGGDALQYQLSNAIASLNCSERAAKNEATSVVTREENDTVSEQQVNGQSARMHMKEVQLLVGLRQL